MTLMLALAAFPCQTVAGTAGVAEAGSVLTPKGPIASAQLLHLYEITALTMIAVLPVLVLVPLLLWRYRYGNKAASYAPDWDQSRVLDLMMWGVPCAIIAIAGALLWRSTMALDPYRPITTPREAMQIEVVGLDWKWLFLYPDQGLATIGELAFPASRPLAFELTSDTVMQAFMIGALGGQVYAMPGMRTQLHLSADAPGRFTGKNMQYSGEGFHTQKFAAVAMSDAEFADWLAKARAVAVPLDAPAYATLAQRSTKDEVRATFGNATMENGTVVFRLEDPALFDRIIERYRGSAPVVPDAQPGSPQYQPGRTAGVQR